MNPTYLYFNARYFSLNDTVQVNSTIYRVIEVVKPSILRTILRYFKVKLPRLGTVRVEYLKTIILNDQLN